jgi:restriction system protein
MPIPDFQSVMLPSLIVISKMGVASNREIVRQVSDHFKLSDSEKQELLPSGKQRIIDNRIHWAITYMAKAGLISRPSRGN